MDPRSTVPSWRQATICIELSTMMRFCGFVFSQSKWNEMNTKSTALMKSAATSISTKVSTESHSTPSPPTGSKTHFFVCFGQVLVLLPQDRRYPTDAATENAAPQSVILEPTIYPTASSPTIFPTQENPSAVGPVSVPLINSFSLSTPSTCRTYK